MNKKRIKLIVGSKNPVKVNAARVGLATVFPDVVIDCEGLHASSGVADQPMTAAETRQGAINRVTFCRQHAAADYYVAFEGGVDLLDDGPATFAYIAVADRSRQSIGRSTLLPLPQVAYQALLKGEELGDTMDRLFNTSNVKQKEGAIGLLTNGHATRESIYTQALILAMAPFLNAEVYGI